MKKILSAAVLVVLLNLVGCYTVLWTPGMDNTIPGNTYAYDDSSYYYGDSNYSANNNDSTNYDSNQDNINVIIGGDYFYDPYYYGPYTQFYHHPWWLSYSSKPVVKNRNDKKEVNRTGSSTGVVRNSGEGRGEISRGSGSPTVPIINNAPPTVSVPGSTNTGTTSSSSSTTKTRQSTTSSSDNNNNGSTRNSSSGSVRNSDGNRNDGGRR